ncbi:hypothetical protein AK812_SmicGene40262 [Symbiodinium microadriaticum]|uniref:Uncharacterized protein n=1 Tax=Symbiodinium microadriaticum TaxID=2951 RepID=A0A1Q9C929_SYMMI|nr:hypothetical protein AK812_SmicGene40262 [Symbiodinium microadriaticum]CAE7853226.1 unnamed protein product [Symbiodinium sp. KB8]CAE7863126.1 unnamed protein product [Symbiodinium microadriaticum]
MREEGGAWRLLIPLPFWAPAAVPALQRWEAKVLLTMAIEHVAALLVQPMSTERFVRRRWDGQIVEVDEFQVAKALSTAELEFLSHEVDSKNLFDWCLHFNHHRTAAALISYSVPGLPPPVACCTHGTQLQR